MRRSMAIGSFAVASMLLVAACSSSSGTSPTAASSGGSVSTPTQSAGTTDASSPLKIIAGKLNFDFSKYCGTKPVVVGVIDGFGGNAWATGKSALVKQLAHSCKNVTDVKYADANGDVQKYIAAVNSMVAQGVNVIETFDYMGQPTVATMAAAQAKGVLIGSANAIPGNGTVPTDFTSIVLPDITADAQAWVKFLTKATGNKGQIAYMGGPAGNLFDGPAFAAVQKAIQDQGSGIQLVTPQPLVGAWDPATTQQAMAGYLQKNSKVGGVITSDMATSPAVVRAFQAAGVSLPAIAGQSSSMEMVCLIHKDQSAGLQVFSSDGTPNLHAVDLAKLLAKWSGISAPELGPTNAFTTAPLATYIDTGSNVLPACDTSVPPGADFSEAMDPTALAAALK